MGNERLWDLYLSLRLVDLVIDFVLSQLHPVVLGCSLDGRFLTLGVRFVEKGLSTLDSTDHPVFYALVCVFIHFYLCVITFCCIVLVLNLLLLAVCEGPITP